MSRQIRTFCVEDFRDIWRSEQLHLHENKKIAINHLNNMICVLSQSSTNSTNFYSFVRKDETEYPLVEYFELKAVMPARLKEMLHGFEVAFLREPKNSVDEPKVIKKKIYELWLSSPSRFEIYKMIFDPKLPYYIFERSGKTYFNQWGGYYMERASKMWEEIRTYKSNNGGGGELFEDEEVNDEFDKMEENYYVSLNNFELNEEKKRIFVKCTQLHDILFHVKNVLCRGNKAVTEYIFKWLAKIVQHPGVRFDKTVIFIGPQGSGKTIFFKFFIQKILGTVHAVYLDNGEDLLNKFNTNLSQKLFVASDEVHFGDKETSNKLKNMITTGKRRTERKFHDCEMEDNYLNHVWTSNDNHPVKLEPGSNRRYFITGVNPEFVEDAEYFNKFRDSFHYAAEMFFCFLKLVNIDKFTVQSSPITEELYYATSSTLTDIDRWWSKTIEERTNTDDVCNPNNVEEYDPHNKRWKITKLSLSNLYTRFTWYMQMNKGKMKINNINDFFYQFIFLLPKFETTDELDYSVRYISIPTLEVCKKYLMNTYRLEPTVIEKKDNTRKRGSSGQLRIQQYFPPQTSPKNTRDLLIEEDD